jgi:hypothetical protein
MIITESKDAFDFINRRFSKVLLVETQLIKYPPLGLLKLYSFYKYKMGVPYVDMHYGKLAFHGTRPDIIFISSGEFSYYHRKLISIVEFYQREFHGVPIVVGGVYVIANKDVRLELESLGCIVIATNINELDNTLYYVDYHLYNWNPFQFVFTTRGCTRACKFCYVKTIEPEHFILDSWKNQILAPDSPKYLMIHDNNILSFGPKHVRDVIDTICEAKRPVIFNGGFDVRYWNEDYNNLTQKLYMRKLCGNQSIRFAFDNMTEDQKIQSALKDVSEYYQNMEEILVYILVGDGDIEEAKYRAAEVARFGAYPFIQVYTPIEYKDENVFNYKGEKWNPEIRVLHDYYNYKHFKNVSYELFLEDYKKRGLIEI